MNKIGVFIGKFQPFHLGHGSIIEKMLEDNLKMILIIICGPANPLNFNERKIMIKYLYNNDNIKFIFMEDFNNPTIWYNELIKRINIYSKNNEIIFYGHQKDVDKKYYQFKEKEYYGHYYDIFEIEKYEVKYLKNYRNINARDIKINKILAKESLNDEIFNYLIQINFFND